MHSFPQYLAPKSPTRFPEDPILNWVLRLSKPRHANKQHPCPIFFAAKQRAVELQFLWEGSCRSSIRWSAGHSIDPCASFLPFARNSEDLKSLHARQKLRPIFASLRPQFGG